MLSQKLVDGIVPSSANLNLSFQNKLSNYSSNLIKFERDEDFHRVAKIRDGLRSSKKNENAGGVTADTAGKSTGTRGGGFKKFGQAVLQQSNAGPVTENWSPKRTGVSFADDSNSTHSKVLDLTGKSQAPLVNNALVLSGR